jgi:hypothetical protein
MRMASGRLALLLSMALVLLALLAPACSKKTVSADVARSARIVLSEMR